MTRIGLRDCLGPQWRTIGSRWSLLALVAAPQVLALLAAALIYALASNPDPYADHWVWAILAVAFAGLRIATLKTNLVTSTYALDALGMAVFIGGTGDAASPFFTLALAGAWWAAAKKRCGTLYGVAFAIGYAVLVAPTALRHGDLAAVAYQPGVVAVIGLLADRLQPMWDTSRWAFAILDANQDGETPESVRVGLSRAIRGGLVPIDVLVTAGQLGLTAVQTELIAYLILGLSNQQIAEALSVSEATVRYRLTRLYRVLDVRGRKAAAERAHELGLDALVGAAGTNAVAGRHRSAPN